MAGNWHSTTCRFAENGRRPEDLRPGGVAFWGDVNQLRKTRDSEPILDSDTGIQMGTFVIIGIKAGEIKKGCRGADVLKLITGGVPAMHLEVDREKYFWYHHTDADTTDKLNPAEFNRCVASMAVMAYVVADLPKPLAR